VPSLKILNREIKELFRTVQTYLFIKRVMPGLTRYPLAHCPK
jgi:hypothetical protein